MAAKSSEPSPGTVKAPLTTASRKLSLVRSSPSITAHAHVLRVDVADALVMLVDHAQHVAAGEGHVASVEEQRQRGARVRHQKVELRLGLDRRGHVVVVGDRHALVRAPFGESRHLAP